MTMSRRSPRRSGALASALLLVLGGGTATAQQPAPVDTTARPQAVAGRDVDAAFKLALRRELEAINVAMTTAFNGGDYLAAARFYTDDAQIIGPGGVRVTGREAVDRYWTSLPRGSTWKLEVLDVGGSTASAWQLGRSTLVTPSREGAGTPNTSIVDFIAIWKRQPDRSLKLYIDMYVPAPRPPAQRAPAGR
jgi:ketosteroid isomerase-like protein